jgi:hypothetical protein
MTFKEQIDALKQKISSKITADSTPEETEEITGIITEIDALDSAHSELETEHAKTKSALVRMVVNQGSSDKPKDDTDGSKPKTIDECVAEELAKGGK